MANMLEKHFTESEKRNVLSRAQVEMTTTTTTTTAAAATTTKTTNVLCVAYRIVQSR